MKRDAFLEPWLLCFLGMPILQAITWSAVLLKLIADHTPWRHCLHLSTKSSPFLYRSWRSNSNVIVNDRVELSDTSQRAHWLCCVDYILILWRVTEKKIYCTSACKFCLLIFFTKFSLRILNFYLRMSDSWVFFFRLLSFGLLVAAVLITNGCHLLYLCPLNTLYCFLY